MRLQPSKGVDLSLWTDLGFRSSPYETDPIPATEEGNQLLVGREKEIVKLGRYLTSSALHPTVEGDNGVGKSSLVAITGYRLKTQFSTGASAHAVIPLPRSFQLSASDTSTSFAQRVLYEVAQAFIENHDLLKSRGHNAPSVGAVNEWLNSPVFKSKGGGGSILGSGVQAHWGGEPNTSQGFADAGFVTTVTRWLRACFPARESGGFLGVIDNLELLETSKTARSLLEAMRDDVLDLPGLLWVLCGARGIVRTGASSPRLEGRLTEPLELDPVADSDVHKAIERRIDVFRVVDNAVAPVGPDGFKHLYEVLHRNLRNALKYSEDFAFWIVDHEASWTEEQVRDLLDVWLTEQADKAHDATRLGERAWGVFDGIAQGGGAVSPSEFSSFGFNSYAAMRPHVLNLEEAQLVVSTVDDSDKRRKTIGLTPRGWLVRYARNDYKLPND